MSATAVHPRTTGDATLPRGRTALAALVLAALALVVATACSRAVAVGSAPAVTYAVNVTNASGADLAVSWDDGAGPRTLGLVSAGGTERFIIAAPRRTSITVSGATPDGSRTVGPVSVELRPGTPASITLR